MDKINTAARGVFRIGGGAAGFPPWRTQKTSEKEERKKDIKLMCWDPLTLIFRDKTIFFSWNGARHKYIITKEDYTELTGLIINITNFAPPPQPNPENAHHGSSKCFESEGFKRGMFREKTQAPLSTFPPSQAHFFRAGGRLKWYSISKILITF